MHTTAQVVNSCSTHTMVCHYQDLHVLDAVGTEVDSVLTVDFVTVDSGDDVTVSVVAIGGTHTQNPRFKQYSTTAPQCTTQCYLLGIVHVCSQYLGSYIHSD